MGRPRTDRTTPRSQTLPSSPTHSFSSSSEFEFTISLSPRKSSAVADSGLCPADDLFYKGQLLPLHLSPRLSMVRTLLSSSSTSSSASSATTAASGRNSTSTSSSSRPSSATECDSSRPSSATEDDELKRLNNTTTHHLHQIKKPNKYFSSLSRFSSVFRVKDQKTRDPGNLSGSSVKRVSETAKEVFRKYMKKVKPLYEKLSSQKQQQQQQKISTNSMTNLSLCLKPDGSVKEREFPLPIEIKGTNTGSISHSFSGNLKYPRKKTCVSSCPSSMRSSPNHSGILYRNGLPGMNPGKAPCHSDASSMEELQSAIQGAIAHCKKSMVENKSIMVSDDI